MDEQLQKQQREEDAIVKLLVLGTGESGKSTVFKQMKILYSVPDPPSKFVMVVRANLYGNAHTVYDGMEKLNIAFQTDEGKKAATLLKGKPADGNCETDPEIEAAFVTMYKDGGVDEAIERAAEYQLNDSTRYFWERSAEVLKSDYLPDEQDILRARVRTTGIVQQNFQIKTKRYTMFDVGGQRNERRKWIHCFDNVTAVIFVTAVSEYDQVLYEDENTNRMDEALTLFDQICNHASFQKTSMILFLNKRDLFEMKLKKKDMTAWLPETAEDKGGPGQDYDKCIDYITDKFLKKNKNPEKRQVYCHATCATDTSNVSFVMGSVFDIILKENLRKMENVDVDKLVGSADAAAVKTVKSGVASWSKGTILVVSCQFTEELAERKVLVEAANKDRIPGVEMSVGKIDPDGTDWIALMSLGKAIPTTEGSGDAAFIANFKSACKELRTNVLGESETFDLGFVYDTPIFLKKADITLIVCVKKVDKSGPCNAKFKWSDTHEDFENPHYLSFDGADTNKTPCKAPSKDDEFNPFAANPVGFRWFKGVTLFTAQVNAIPDKGVYLGLLKVASASTGFKIMVNEHNRIMIPLIFLTCTQLTDEEIGWMHGVRVRWSKGIKLLEGKKPNRGWLGPEMSGEEGATFAEKLWWAIDEAKSRLDTQSLGEFYDTEVIDVDENNNIQLVLFASLAKDEDDCLPGHIYVDRGFLEIQNMKYLCPKTLNSILADQASLIAKYTEVAGSQTSDHQEMLAKKQQKDELKGQITEAAKAQTPLKWVNRVILWCADKMPSFADKIPGNKDMDAAELVKKAMEGNVAVAKNKKDRTELIKKHNSS